MNRHLPRMLTAVLTLALATSAPAAILAPDDLHFGSREPGEVVEASVWLINTENEPLEVLEAKATCGCTTIIGFAPQTLPPRSALEVALRVTAPKKAGHSKAVSVKFTVKGRSPIMLPIRVETTGSPPERGAITAAPPDLDLGRVTAAAPAHSMIRLTNTGAALMRVTGAKAGCGCITFPDFAPFALEAGASADVRINIKTPSVVGRPKTKDVTFIVEDHPPVKVPVRIQAVHPLVDTLEQYLGLSGTDDSAGRCYDDFRVDGNTVSTIVWAAETPRARLVCRFDEVGQVRGIRVEPITTAPAVIRSARRD